MSIRLRLTLQFLAIAAIVLGIACVAIYFFSEDYRKDEFYSRLENRGRNIAKLLIQVDEVNEDLLRKIEEDNPVRLPEEVIRIYDYKNKLLYNTDDEGHIDASAGLLNQIRLDSVIQFEDGPMEVLGFLFSDRFDRFVVITSANDVYGKSKVQNLLQVLVSVFCLSLIVLFFAGRLYAARALVPLSRLIDEMESITPANLEKRVSEGNGQDEIAQLAKSFNSLLKRVEDAFQSQKNFIANASHEIRTPLTSITGQLDVLMLRDREPEEYKQYISSVLDDIKNLNKLANRLLLLAQTGTDALRVSFENVRIDETLWEAQTDIIRLKNDYKVTLHMGSEIEDESQLMVIGSAPLLKTAFFNLMENGCKYSSGSTVDVRVNAVPGFVRMAFIDKGMGIPKKDLQNIFEPFYRAQNALQKTGHGIGLSLVKRIVELHKGSIEVTSTEGSGTIFTVFLPILP